MTPLRILLPFATLLMLSLLGASAFAQDYAHPEAPDRLPPSAPSADAGEAPRYSLHPWRQKRWGKPYLEWRLYDRQTGVSYKQADFYRVLGHPELGEQLEENFARHTRAYFWGPLLMGLSVPVLAVSGGMLSFWGLIAGMGGPMVLSPMEVAAMLAGAVVGGAAFATGLHFRRWRYAISLTLLSERDAQRLVDEANARGTLFDAHGNALLRETPSSFRLSVAPYVRPTLGRSGASGVAGGLGLRGSW